MQSGHPPDCAIEGGNRNIYLCHGSIVYSWRKAVSATVASTRMICMEVRHKCLSA